MLRFGNVSRFTATITALGAFATAALSGLFAGHTAPQILLTSMVSMIACFVLGMLIGAAFEAAVHDRVGQFVRDNPVPLASPRRAAGGVSESDSVEILEEAA